MWGVRWVPDQELETKATGASAPAEPVITEEDRLLLEKYSRSFTGNFAHSLDSKGRMVVPLAFRDMLGKVFTIAPSFDFKSIAIYPDIAYVRMRDRYARVYEELGKSEILDYLQWLDAFTYRSQECDGQGRVLLPARLRQVMLGDDKEVDIMGDGDHLRVAARVKCDEQFANFVANIKLNLSAMNVR